jgi:hypothetical protein
LLAGWLVTLVVIAVLLVGNTFAFALFGGFLWVCWAAIR